MGDAGLVRLRGGDHDDVVRESAGDQRPERDQAGRVNAVVVRDEDAHLRLSREDSVSGGAGS